MQGSNRDTDVENGLVAAAWEAKSSSGDCSLWMGLEEWLVKAFWLWKLALVFWWMELDLFSLECNEASSTSFEVSVGLV